MSKIILIFLLVCAASFGMAISGCAKKPGKPTLISFTGKGKGQESAEKMKPIISKLKKKYRGKVIFRDVDMDDPANKDELKKYYVTMNPTFVVLDAEGKIKHTFLGAAHEEMLESAISGYLPALSREKEGSSSAEPSNPSPEYSPQESQDNTEQNP